MSEPAARRGQRPERDSLFWDLEAKRAHCAAHELADARASRIVLGCGDRVRSAPQEAWDAAPFGVLPPSA